MNVAVRVVGIDIPKQVITLGNVDNGCIRNKCVYKIMPCIIPFALQALGKNAWVAIHYNTIYNLDPVETNLGYRNKNRACGMSGMIIDNVDGLKREVSFSMPDNNKIRFKAFIHSKAQVNALELLGKPCTFYLATKARRETYNYKTIVAVTGGVHQLNDVPVNV